MNKRVADGIKDNNGYWQHGHTYQVSSFVGKTLGYQYIEI